MDRSIQEINTILNSTTADFVNDAEIIPRGFYTVGDRKFRNKVDALAYHAASNQAIYWNFHDEMFAKSNWTNEPQKDISYYYTLRCQQIRDEYQYLVLHYSGGSDSNNILTHFYRSGIHIDQINVTAPVEYYETHTQANLSRHAKDLHNEWYYVIKPDLDWIRQNMPGTKITVYDYTHDMLEFKVDQDWITYSGEHCNPNVVAWIKNYDVVESKIYDSKKVGHIYGIDKPRVFLHQNQWYFSFLDSILTIMSNYRPAWLKHDHTNILNFYWSPQAPELLIKQAHLVKKYYEQNPQFLNLATFKALTRQEFEMQQNIIKAAVYPFWRADIFQVNKARNTFFKEFDQWFHELATDSAKNRWNEGYQYLLKTVPENWFDKDSQDRYCGLKGIWSKWHNLGPHLNFPVEL